MNVGNRRATLPQSQKRVTSAASCCDHLPSFDPRPERKRGRGSKLGGRRAPVGRCLLGGDVVSGCVGVFFRPCRSNLLRLEAVAAGFDIADRDVKNQSSFGAVQAAEARAV